MQTPATPPGRGAVQVPRLGTTEQLVLLALRARAEGPASLPLLRGVFRSAFGLSQLEVGLAGFERAFGALVLGARRWPLFARRAAPAATADERAVLNLLAAQQWRHARLARGLIEWLVRPPAAALLGEGAAALAAALARSGCLAPAPGIRPATPARSPPPVASPITQPRAPRTPTTHRPTARRLAAPGPITQPPATHGEAEQTS